MYCSSCGRKIDDDAAFCQWCGKKVTVSMQENRSVVTESREIELDRKALTIYLHDVLTLECIKKKYIDRINSIGRSLQNTSDTYCEKKYKSDYFNDGFDGMLYFLYSKGRYYLYCRRSSTLYAAHAYTDCWETKFPKHHSNLFPDDCFFMDIEKEYSHIMKLGTWSCWPILSESNILAKRKRAKKAQDFFLNCYDDFKKTAPGMLRENKKKIDRWLNLRKSISDELKEAKAILAKIYELNIIPNQFRNNIYAIYYFYDFIRSSNQSFTTALLHFDLQEIKAKLDKIIEQQQEIIIQQALIIAQNDEIIEQNRAHLEKLSDLSRTAANVEYNTSQAATYAAIAANNAEVCAWIGLANYLKN